ncbi:MAG: methylmalonyl-CoA mutase [Acidimicrobiaceae bacterium]|nr:methylmalonyl-CoA mutase [Acidimicrobiaceae bacterium]MYC41354.1 methylmalonyl-CoA mutase [Acidimicrobiaceae bacterium]MYH88898.1 methylmalonyl-CoA mutase [Acidimicrobiaceae bacterium]
MSLCLGSRVKTKNQSQDRTVTQPEFDSRFPNAELSDWTDAVAKVLRGRSFDDVLVSTTLDDLEIRPLYTASDSVEAAKFVPVDAQRLERGWNVRQQFNGEDPDACNRTVLEELELGVTSVELTPPTPNWTLDALQRATTGVLFDLAEVVLAPHADINAARALAAVIQQQGDSATTASWLGLDPIGEVARGGFANADDVTNVAASLVTSLPTGRTLSVDSTRYAEAGASEACELAYSIATGVAYLRLLESFDVAPLLGANTIGFRLSIGADQFVTMAKLRAARRIWARVLEASGVDPTAAPQLQQAVTGRAIYSRRDPWVNMLRATTAAFAAGVGGADSVTVLPFNEAFGPADDFSRRLARNTQTVLIEESHLARVVDPASGAWFVESLTARLAAQAWAEFTEVEAAGGMEAAIADGSVRAAIDSSWQRRLEALHTRREVITGVSEFPDLADQERAAQERAAQERAAQERFDQELAVEGSEEEGLPLRRLAAPFESLRDAADRHLLATGERPRVHIAALGELATHTSRSTWVSNLLAVAGVACSGAQAHGSQSPLEAEARFSESGASLAVICSSDPVYALRAVGTALALREAGAKRVILAGQPGDLRAELETAGVDEFWYQGMDVVDALTRLHADLGV